MVITQYTLITIIFNSFFSAQIVHRLPSIKRVLQIEGVVEDSLNAYQALQI